MKIEEKKLSNGSKIIGLKLPGTKSVVISFGFRVGSRNETRDNSGISHFLEHMVFKGSVSRPSTEIISRAADGIGAQYNAFTGKEYTVYYIKTTLENFTEALDIVGDMVTRPLLLDAEIDKERETVIQELKMYEDNPSISIHDKLENSVYGDNPVGWNIGGFLESVRAINETMMRNYFNQNYNGSNARIVISGDLPEDYLVQVKKYAKRLPKGTVTNWKKPSLNDQRLLFEQKSTEQAHLGFAIPAIDIFDKDHHIVQVVVGILGGYMSSRLFTEIREKRGWAYQVAAFSEELTDTGYFGVISGVKKEKAVEALEIVKNEVFNLPDTVTEEEVRRAVENIKGSCTLKYDNPEDLGNYIVVRALLKDTVELPSEYVERVSRVTHSDVVRVAKKIFAEEKFYLAVVAPFKDGEKFGKILNQ